MKVDNPFDKALKTRKVREPFLGAAVDVTDTLDLAWDSARAVFEEAATPTHAIAIAELILRASGRITTPGCNCSHPSEPLHTDTE